MCPICSQGDAARREPCFRPIQRAQPLSPPEQRRSESTSSSWPTKVEHRTTSRSSQSSGAGASCKPIANSGRPSAPGAHKYVRRYVLPGRVGSVVDPLTEERVISEGRWHPTVRPGSSDPGDRRAEAIVLVDGNGDGSEVEREQWYLTEGGWVPGSSGGMGSFDRRALWTWGTTGGTGYVIGCAEPGQSVAVEWMDAEQRATANDVGIWGVPVPDRLPSPRAAGVPNNSFQGLTPEESAGVSRDRPRVIQSALGRDCEPPTSAPDASEPEWAFSETGEIITEGDPDLQPLGPPEPGSAPTGRPRHTSAASSGMATTMETMEAHWFGNRAVCPSREARPVPRLTKPGNYSTPPNPAD